MFSVSLRAFLWFNLCVCAASTAVNNGTLDNNFDVVEAHGASFTYHGNDNNSSRGHVLNGTVPGERLSEPALSFLTGPVSTIFLPSFYTLVCSISVPVNICAVLAFTLGIRPKKPAVIYMLNLAFADLLFAMMLPFKIFYHFEGNNWKFGSFMCRMVTAAFYWNMYCSVLLITCISVDRLLAVVYPISFLAWKSPQKAVIACITMWILSFAGSVPLVISDQIFHISELNIITCHDVHSSDKEKIMWLKTYFLTLCCVLFFLPLLITVVSYTRVIWSLSRGQHNVPGSSNRRRRAVVMVLMVLVIFVLCFMPTNCLLLAHYLQLYEGVESHEAPDGTYSLYLVFLCLGSLNCLLDPLLYYFGSSQCQRQLSKMLQHHNCSKSSDSHSSHTEGKEINPSVQQR